MPLPLIEAAERAIQSQHTRTTFSPQCQSGQQEAEEYEPPEEERKRAARVRRSQTGQHASHEGMYLAKPGVLVYSTFEDYSKHFRVRYAGLVHACF